MWWRGHTLDVEELQAGRGWPSERELMLALMEIRRFGGVGISVWEHSRMVAERAYRILQRDYTRMMTISTETVLALHRAALWHDAAEAITGDVIAPVRRAGGGVIDEELDRWQGAAYIALGISASPMVLTIVSQADREVGAEELRRLMRSWEGRRE